MSNFREGWYLLYTRPHHEQKVHAVLTEMEINTFLPTQKKIRIWHDRKKIVDEPLFPSYIFIYLDSVQHYFDSLDTKGVLYCVRRGKDIAQVSDVVINNIRLAANNDAGLEVSSRQFQPGQRMIIREGVLTGLSCELVMIDERKKLLVRVDLLQRNLLMTMPAEALVAI